MSETTDNTNATPVVKAKDIKDSDIVIVKSLVSSVHYTCPKTLDSFSWAEVGDTNEMTFAQLKVMKTKHNGYFTKKWLYPQNEAALKKLGIDTIFAVKFEKRDMKLLYGNDVEAVKEKISYVPTVDRPAMVDKIEKAVKQGKIVNIKIIRLLEKEFGIDLMDLV
jgi:hypothetical protein